MPLSFIPLATRCNSFHFAGDPFPGHCRPLSLSSLFNPKSTYCHWAIIYFFSKNLSSHFLANIFACLSFGPSPLFDSCRFPSVTIIQSRPKSVLSPTCHQLVNTALHPTQFHCWSCQIFPFYFDIIPLIIITTANCAACRLDL